MISQAITIATKSNSTKRNSLPDYIVYLQLNVICNGRRKRRLEVAGGRERGERLVRGIKLQNSFAVNNERKLFPREVRDSHCCREKSSLSVSFAVQMQILLKYTCIYTTPILQRGRDRKINSQKEIEIRKYKQIKMLKEIN